MPRLTIAPVLASFILLQAHTIRADNVIPDVVSLSAPLDGASVDARSVTFVWDPVAGAVTYDLSLSLSVTFTSHVDSLGIGTTSKVVRNLPAGRTVYWRVRAVDMLGPGEWSSIWRVSTRVSVDSVADSVKPLTELKTVLYQGYAGGLYPDGVNDLPLIHLEGGLRESRLVLPRDTVGSVDAANGHIVLLSIGMSNATQEFSVFKGMADTFRLRNRRLVIVDGAQGGQTASVIADTAANFWSVIDQRLQSAGVSRQQVQAVWLKEANAGPTAPFPRHARDLQNDLASIVRYLPVRFPHVRLVYLSSRVYGGWATTTLNPEMYAYESGFSVKWLIEGQIGGDSSLSFEGQHRRAPWLAWGPYLWANGLHPRVADGLIWQQNDFVADGTHPSASGRAKVARMLLDFFRSDTTTIGWFLESTSSAVDGASPSMTPQLTCHRAGTATTIFIEYSIAHPGIVSLDVLDMEGSTVTTIVRGVREAGAHRIDYHCTTTDGDALPSGLYLVRLTSRDSSLIARLAVVR